MLTAMFVGAFIEIGIKKYGVDWTTQQKDVKTDDNGKETVLLTYSRARTWILRGIYEIIRFLILFFVWRLWKYAAIGMKYIAIGIWKAMTFLCWSAWYLFKLIHKQERVLCGIDGAIGGTVSYILLASSSRTLTEQLVLILFGGLIGAVFGVADYEIVSKRVLHLV